MPESAAWAREKSAECLELAAESSIQRGTALMAMARIWIALANQIERVDAITREEEARPPYDDLENLWGQNLSG